MGIAGGSRRTRLILVVGRYARPRPSPRSALTTCSTSTRLGCMTIDQHLAAANVNARDHVDENRSGRTVDRRASVRLGPLTVASPSISVDSTSRQESSCSPRAHRRAARNVGLGPRRELLPDAYPADRLSRRVTRPFRRLGAAAKHPGLVPARARNIRVRLGSPVGSGPRARTGG